MEVDVWCSLVEMRIYHPIALMLEGCFPVTTYTTYLMKFVTMFNQGNKENIKKIYEEKKDEERRIVRAAHDRCIHSSNVADCYSSMEE
ncbi:hypothetical protein Tco_0690472, partial [Tanacetum coccineum]